MLEFLRNIGSPALAHRQTVLYDIEYRTENRYELGCKRRNREGKGMAEYCEWHYFPVIGHLHKTVGKVTFKLNTHTPYVY